MEQARKDKDLQDKDPEPPKPNIGVEKKYIPKAAKASDEKKEEPTKDAPKDEL